MSDNILKKLKCKCGDYFLSRYSDEYLQNRFPYKENDKSIKNLRNMNKWLKYKRQLKCPSCGKKKKISRRLLMRISSYNYDRVNK